MKLLQSSTALAIILLTAGMAANAESTVNAVDRTVNAVDRTGNVAAVQPLEAGWNVREANHICGLSSANQLSHPALIDFDAVMAATVEMKTIRREGIDPSSPRGQQLVNRASRHVADAAKRVMADASHCSIWKAVSHSDGRAISDVTAQVRGNLARANAGL